MNYSKWLVYFFTPITVPFWGAIIAGVLGVAGSLYSADQQQQANNKLQDDADNAAEQARQNEQKILAQNAKEAEDNKATVLFGTQDDDEIGTYDDFFAPAPQQVVTAKNTGLGIS